MQMGQLARQLDAQRRITWRPSRLSRAKKSSPSVLWHTAILIRVWDRSWDWGILTAIEPLSRTAVLRRGYAVGVPIAGGIQWITSVEHYMVTRCPGFPQSGHGLIGTLNLSYTNETALLTAISA